MKKALSNLSKKAFLARLRQARGKLTQEEVASTTGISQPVLSKMERGHREPTAMELKKLADFYQQPLSFFFGDQEPSMQEKSDTKNLQYPVPVTLDLLQRMAREIVATFNPEKIILFGSRAWGKPHRDSDVDLLVMTDALGPLRPAQRRRIVKAVCQPPLVPMDVLVNTPEEVHQRIASGDLFLDKILHEGKVLYERPHRE
jgi:transcriptional regulator with XRE-family HTH domain